MKIQIKNADVELTTEQAQELVEQINKQLNDDWFKKGVTYYMLDKINRVYEYIHTGSLLDQQRREEGFVAQTREECEDEIKRRMSIKNAYHPKDGERFCYWSLIGGEVNYAYNAIHFISEIYLGAAFPDTDQGRINCDTWGKEVAPLFTKFIRNE
jgi:hypothetical protein